MSKVRVYLRWRNHYGLRLANYSLKALALTRYLVSKSKSHFDKVVRLSRFIFLIFRDAGFSDIPQVFNISTLQHDSDGNPISWDKLRSIQSSKGTGEPPLFLGSTVFFALREAVKAARTMNNVDTPLIFNAPSTAEKLRLAVEDDMVRRAAVRPKEGEKEFFIRIEA